MTWSQAMEAALTITREEGWKTQVFGYRSPRNGRWYYTYGAVRPLEAS